jgi:peptidoglycan/xylan/chitin deacetylase (PgdA/CDA1 family)
MRYSFRNIIGYFFAQVLIITGTLKRSKKKLLTKEYIIPFYFHNPTKEEFNFIITYYQKNGFSFISVNDLIKIIGGEVPFPKAKVLITVDDGWSTNVSNICEVAMNENIPVAIFLATEAVEKGFYWFSSAKKARIKKLGFPSSNNLKKLPNAERLKIVEKINKVINPEREAMTIEQVKKIGKSKWITFGGHSHSHPILNRCNEKELFFEVEYCKQKIENWLNEEINSFAYPNGDFGQREINALKVAGYRIGFANNPEFITPVNINDNYKIPRIGFLEGASNAENKCRAMGIWRNPLKSLISKK